MSNKTEQTQLQEIIDDVKHAMEMYPEKEVAFIVRAANSHKALLEAAKRGISALAANGAPNCEAVKELRAAIAHAEGGK